MPPPPQAEAPSDSAASGAGAAHASITTGAKPTPQAPVAVRRELAWVCTECERTCWPIRAESRCLCGHRLKEHTAGRRACGNARCSCDAFYFIVAEGAWSLRCRCKHKAVEHDARSRACAKCKGGGCAGFDSPWVCNCDHAWAAHRQVEVESKVVTMAERMGGSAGPDAATAAAAAAVAAAAAAKEMEAFRVVRRGQP
ncbi:MAG: hypothetical protein J3K34DRAFT_432046 [Monoraphidium minutum]|nr:MAG: hypothetical protein J3K34DRAFT_432046 [Monoraphidium minutum]